MAQGRRLFYSITIMGLNTSALDGIIGYRLRRAQLAVFAEFAAAFRELSLRPADYSALVLIADNPGRRQADLALALTMQRANLVALIDGLEARGFVERRPVAGDRRSNALFLTEEGEALTAKARAVQDAFEAALVGRIGGTKARDALIAMLEKIA
jgi:DNA-binding MarR family transcriptional regulator